MVLMTERGWLRSCMVTIQRSRSHGFVEKRRRVVMIGRSGRRRRRRR